MNSAARRGQLFSVPRASIDEDLFTAGNFFKSIYSREEAFNRSRSFPNSAKVAGKRPGRVRIFLRSISRCDDSDAEVERREPSEGEKPALFPEKRDRENIEKDKPKTESEKKQQGEQQSLFQPLPFFFQLRNKQFQPRVQSRSDRGNHGFASI